jgi:hypothetical protein
VLWTKELPHGCCDVARYFKLEWARQADTAGGIRDIMRQLSLGSMILGSTASGVWSFWRVCAGSRGAMHSGRRAQTFDIRHDYWCALHDCCGWGGGSRAKGGRRCRRRSEVSAGSVFNYIILYGRAKYCNCIWLSWGLHEAIVSWVDGAMHTCLRPGLAGGRWTVIGYQNWDDMHCCLYDTCISACIKWCSMTGADSHAPHPRPYVVAG